jgi:hypothetical protein
MASASSGVRDAVDGEHRRRPHGGFHGAGRVRREGVRHVQRPHHADAGDADADVEEIDEAARLERGGDRGGVIGGRGPPGVSSSPTRRRPTATRGPTTARTAASVRRSGAGDSRRPPP